MYFSFNSILATVKPPLGKKTALCTCVEFPSASKHLRYESGSQITLKGRWVLVSYNWSYKHKSKFVRVWWDFFKLYRKQLSENLECKVFLNPQISPVRIVYISY